MADSTPPLGRRPARLATVRVRTTLIGVAVVGVALAAASVGLVLALRWSLTDDARSAAAVRAREVAAVLAAGTRPASLELGHEEDGFVQVLDRSGAVLAATANLAGPSPVATVARGGTRRVDGVAVIDRDEPGEVAELETADFVVAAEAVPGDERLTVLVGRALEPVTESARTLARLLLAGTPLVVLAMGAASWALTGRALSPVEAMRREVAAITASGLDRRVPDPAGADEIARLAGTLNAMLDRLEQAQRRQRQLVSDASHELRSPIAAIRQHAEVAAAHPEQVSLEDLAAVVVAETERLQHIVDDLLLVARSDEGALAPERREVDVDDLVLAEARRLRHTTSLTVDTSRLSAGRVLGDEALLSRAVRNIVDNAARHAVSTVAVMLSEDGAGRIRLTVDDDGPGIPAGERARVFERFYRIDAARGRDQGGAGLGLAIVAEVVRAHGGEVTAGASDLGGTRIEVVLPAGG